MVEAGRYATRAMALPPPSPDSTCLVTGASSGIGVEIARLLAGQGHGVTLVARRTERLDQLAAELRDSHGVRAETLGYDLGDADARERMLEELADRGLTVEVLVNNAGFGSGGRFHELDAEGEVRMVRLNVEAVVALCGRYVPPMVSRGRGAVLNVASTAAFQPLPRQATYGASKAFVLSFTEGLHADLAGTGVAATALCPGPVKTEFSEVAGIDEAASGLPNLFWAEADSVAEAAVRGLERGRRVVVPGALNRAGAFGGQHVPRSLLLRVGSKVTPVGR
jgi:short-subunit dehydrogenase